MKMNVQVNHIFIRIVLARSRVHIKGKRELEKGLLTHLTLDAVVVL